MEGGEQIVQTAVENFGKLDIVVTCAGILRDRMVFNMTEQEWDDVIAVHLKGTFTVVKNACILFRQQRSGRIITFTSESGLVGNSGQANYGAAKSGIAGFTKVVAKDMGRYGVTANAIAPRANTRMIGDIPDSAAEIRARSGVAPISGEDQLTELDPDHIAPFICYLASDYAANVNGQTFLVYGDSVSLMSQPRPERSIYEHAQSPARQGSNRNRLRSGHRKGYRHADGPGRGQGCGGGPRRQRRRHRRRPLPRGGCGVGNPPSRWDRSSMFGVRGHHGGRRADRADRRGELR
jgi:NADP-dependent 3-hydroxy acid dehydrogenase YdfG